MSWQTPTINPATTSPATDITKITNDLSVLKSVLTTGTTDTDFSTLKFGYNVTFDTPANASLQFNKSGTNGFKLVDDSSARDLTFLSGGTLERIRFVSATGNLLINSATDDTVNKLQVNGSISSSTNITAAGSVSAAAAQGFYSSGSVVLNAQNPIWRFSSSPTYGMSYFQGSAGIGSVDTIGFHFGTATSVGSKFFITAAGLMSVTAGVKVGNVASSDSGTLDWYEEGTFTPTIVGLTSAGTGTYSLQHGKYQRVGNTVRVHISIIWTAHTGTGNLAIGGLPFAMASSPSVQPMSTYHENLTFASTKASIACAAPTTSQIYMYLIEQGTAATQQAMDTAASINLSGYYYV
jgi:hypothetical protein